MALSRVGEGIPLQNFRQSHLNESTENSKVGRFNSSFKSSYETLNSDWLSEAANFKDTLAAQHREGTFPFDYSTAKTGYDSVEAKMSRLKGEADKNSEKPQRFEFKHAINGAIEFALLESVKASPKLKVEPKKIMEGITWLAHVDPLQAVELAILAKDYPCMAEELTKSPNFEDDLQRVALSQQLTDEFDITTDRVNTLSVKEDSGDTREAQFTMSLTPKMLKQVYKLPKVPEGVKGELEFKMQNFMFRPRPHVTPEQPKPDKIPLFPKALNTVDMFTRHLELVLNDTDTSKTVDQLSRLHTVCFWGVDTLSGESGSEKMITYLKSVHTQVKQCINDKGYEIMDVEPNPRWKS
ncbi:hypothetical protein JQC92_14095 [Shewanella sp. 202IG2-18]|uniref:hypothetical protein n=1 Tax=Parashewanella hymeniacidonis TaxID=2807618 RepID=UPI0019604228|nr:hypothetical protein [Parashewanella hymeniacidonis]MBM7073143.1 hypothetical protein [Parashewanella hymeniacidonis]